MYAHYLHILGHWKLHDAELKKLYELSYLYFKEKSKIEFVKWWKITILSIKPLISLEQFQMKMLCIPKEYMSDKKAK